MVVANHTVGKMPSNAAQPDSVCEFDDVDTGVWDGLQAKKRQTGLGLLFNAREDQ